MNTQHFKEKLEQELSAIERELKTVARRNPENLNDWEPMPEKMDTLTADKNEVADKLESFEENVGMTRQFEARLSELRAALERLKAGSYGLCSVCSGEIEKARLEANPAATTCKKHLNS